MTNLINYKYKIDFKNYAFGVKVPVFMSTVPIPYLDDNCFPISISFVSISLSLVLNVSSVDWIFSLFTQTWPKL